MDSTRDAEAPSEVESPTAFALSLASVIAFDPRDWSINSTDAWIYGIVVGWAGALPEVAELHGWSAETQERITILRTQFRQASHVPGLRCPPPKDANRPTVPEVLPLVRALYNGENECSRRSGIVGGHLHIVLDDGNVDRGHVEWCRDEAAKDGCETCRALAEKMLAMSETQRLRLYREH